MHISVNMDSSTKIMYRITSLSVSGVLISVTFFTLLCYIIVFKWRRRRLEKLAAELPGPPALPIIGNGLEFLGTPEGMY